MSYQAINQLTNDVDFGGRSTAAATQQAEVFINDARPDFVALANDVLRGTRANDFARIIASAPGIADKAATEDDNVVDSSKVTDADLLSTVQANWQVVAGLFYTDDGTPIAPVAA